MYHLIPPTPQNPSLTHSQADAMEFSGHDGFALPSQGSYQSCWEGSRPVWQWYNTCVPSLQMDSHQHLTVVQFQWREQRWHIFQQPVLALHAFLQYISSFNFGFVCFVGVKALFFTSQKNPKYCLCLPYCSLSILVASLAFSEISFMKKLKIAVFMWRCICTAL